MSTALLSLGFDVVLCVLLLATISYCAKLSKRIRLLQDSNGELATIIAHFDQATARASHALSELQTVSKKITDTLQLKLDKANFLADDMAFLIEKGTKLAKELEQARSKPVPAQEEKKNMFSVSVNPSEEKLPEGALEAVLQRLISPDNEQPPAAAQPRTHAERELMHALKSGR